MTNMTKGITETSALLAVLYCARRYYPNWGATKAECHMLFLGDTLVSDPAIQTTEAVYIDAPPFTVWSRLLQIGRDPGGSHDIGALENYSPATSSEVLRCEMPFG